MNVNEFLGNKKYSSNYTTKRSWNNNNYNNYHSRDYNSGYNNYRSRDYNNSYNNYRNRNYNNNYNNYRSRDYNNSYNNYHSRDYNNGYNNYRSPDYNNRKDNRGDWIEKQNYDRQVIYDTMDRMALIVGNDSQKFQEYLDVQSRFEKYSVGNCLVILQNSPNSTKINDEQSWNEKGISLRRDSKSIKILEPVKSSNGIIYYNPKEVYDISQTNAPIPKMIAYRKNDLLEASCFCCKIRRKSVSSLENGKVGVKYNHDENVLYICRGIKQGRFFRELFQEIAKIEMKDEIDSNIKDFRSYCVSYMICKKYGIDVTDFNFEKIPPEIANQREVKKIRNELGIIKNNFEEINKRLVDYFKINQKEKSKSVQER